MKQNPQKFVGSLIKSMGSNDALRIAVESYRNTRITPETEVPEYISRMKDPKSARKLLRERQNASYFWDQVFGLMLKKVQPGTSRKQYLNGVK